MGDVRCGGLSSYDSVTGGRTKIKIQVRLYVGQQVKTVKERGRYKTTEVEKDSIAGTLRSNHWQLPLAASPRIYHLVVPVVCARFLGGHIQ
jgi:hypothetical protein